jgi:hypothetical protein
MAGAPECSEGGLTTRPGLGTCTACVLLNPVVAFLCAVPPWRMRHPMRSAHTRSTSCMGQRRSPQLASRELPQGFSHVSGLQAAAFDRACSGVRIPGMVTATCGLEIQKRRAIRRAVGPRRRAKKAARTFCRRLRKGGPDGPGGAAPPALGGARALRSLPQSGGGAGSIPSRPAVVSQCEDTIKLSMPWGIELRPVAPSEQQSGQRVGLQSYA